MANHSGNPPTGGTSYDLTVGVKINMDEMIYLYSPVDSPLILGVDADGLSVVGQAPVDVTKFDWMDEEILTPRVALDTAVLAGDAVLSVAAGDELAFEIGDTVTLGSPHAESNGEILLVTDNTTSGQLDVTRSYTTAAAGTAEIGDEVIGVGLSLPEGSDPGPARYTDRTERTNYTQIFGPTQVAMSRTETRVAKYGVASEWDHQLQQRIKESLITREQAFLYQEAGQALGAGKTRTTGGLGNFIVTNTDATSTALNVTTITANMQACWLAGGVPEILMANPVALADLNDTDNTNRVRVDFDDPRRGRETVTTVVTEFGDITVSRNRWMRTTDAFGFTREGVTRRVFDPLLYENLAKTGDSTKGQIVCEEGLQVKGERHMFRMNALTY